MAKKIIPFPTLSTRRLRLRQFRIEDAEAMHACFTNAEAMRFWNQPLYAKPIESERAVRGWIECTPAYYRVWAVADAKTDRCFGLVNYHDGHIRNMRVSIGWMIHPAHQREGFGSEAVSAMVDFCFGEIGLHRIQAFIHPDNAASRKLAENLGFRSEGLLRDNLRVGDEWRDEMLYALLTTEWRNPAR